MYQVKLIILGLLLICIGSASAWDSEGGFAENETYEIVWNDDLHCWEHKNIERPSTYQRIVGSIYNTWFTIKSFFLTTVGLNINYHVDKYEWDGSAYQQTDSDTFSWDLSHNANHTETTVSTFDPVEEYFKDNDTRVDEWNGDDPDHPDVLNITVIIDGDGESLDDSNYGYVTMSNNVAEGLGGGDKDYGFGTGRGADGGSGGIYEGLNIYGSGEGDTSGMGGGFNIIFWILVPFIFMFAVLKLSRRMI